MIRTFRSDYATDSEYSELVLSLQPELHHAYVEPKPTNWDKLGFIEKLLLRVLWVGCGLPLIGVFLIISGPKAFKAFDVRNLIQ
jgi:hypothetical protein